MNQAARGIGRTFTLVLPVVLVLSGTLAVSRVPWSESPSETAVMAAGAERADATDESAEHRNPEDVLLEELLTELQQTDPGTALTSLQAAVEHTPSLAEHCTDLAHALGRAAVEKYDSAALAQEHARPVCDTSFAAGITDSVEPGDGAALS